MATPPVEDEAVDLDERLALHLMMLDVYFMGQAFVELQKLVSKPGRGVTWGSLLIENESAAWVSINGMRGAFTAPFNNELESFLRDIAPELKDTDSGKKAREQLGLWLGLYAGLNNA